MVIFFSSPQRIIHSFQMYRECYFIETNVSQAIKTESDQT